MSDIKLFRVDGGKVAELPGTSVALEKSLQTVIEEHLDVFLGVRFLASEYSTGKTHAGRIDSLGIDEDGSPVIIEYKRSINENVINQGLFYLDWLMDHRGEFELRVLKRYGQAAANGIDWHNPRLVCIAGDFTKYDEHAVAQINRNISLIRYKRFPPDLLMFELVNARVTFTKGGGTVAVAEPAPVKHPPGALDKGFVEVLAAADPAVRDWYEQLRSFIMALGDDVQEKQVKLYVAFKRIKNFACVVAFPKRLQMYLRLHPSAITLEPHFTRDVSAIGHWATGDLEVVITTAEDLAKALPLIQRSYEGG